MVGASPLNPMPECVRTGKQHRFRTIPNSKQETLGLFVLNNVQLERGARMDGWTGCDNSQRPRYQHRALSVRQYHPKTGRHISTIQIVFRGPDPQLLGTQNGVRWKHLLSHLNKIGFLFNRRFWPTAALDRRLRNH
jgi:hypothetical protein